jgi:hypothetical protein
MPVCTFVCGLVAWSSFLPCLHQGAAQPPAPPTEAEIRERIQRLEQSKDAPVRLEALQWLRKHVAARTAPLVIPVLERTIIDDPVSNVREEAALALSAMARKLKRPCPLALVQAIFDEDVSVHQTAAALALQFTAFAPGTVERGFRAAWSEDATLRTDGLHLLALAAPQDEKALAVIETARNDRSFQVRHNAHCFKFLANDKLDEYLVWVIRMQEDRSVLDPVPQDEALRKQEENMRNLAILGSAMQIVEWCEKRPDDLAAALLPLLDHKSPVVRRGAARLIGAAAIKTDLSSPKSGSDLMAKEFSYLFPESESGPPKPGNQPKLRLEESKVAPCLEKRKARERLEKLRDNDLDRAVRQAALSALERLARLRGKP